MNILWQWQIWYLNEFSLLPLKRNMRYRNKHIGPSWWFWSNDTRLVCQIYRSQTVCQTYISYFVIYYMPIWIQLKQYLGVSPQWQISVTCPHRFSQRTQNVVCKTSRFVFLLFLRYIDEATTHWKIIFQEKLLMWYVFVI